MKFLYQTFARTLLLKGIQRNHLPWVQKALKMASQHHLEVVEFDIGEKYPFIDYDGHDWSSRETTPLLLASRLGRKDIIKTLLDHGAKVNEMDTTKFNALEHALAEQHFECAVLLWRAGGEVFEHQTCFELSKSITLEKLQLNQGRWQHRLLEEEALKLQEQLSSTLRDARKSTKKML